MDQEVKVGDFVIATKRIDNEKFNGIMQCTLNQPITLTHAFEAKGYIPIAGSPFKIIKRKKKAPEQFQQIAYMSVNQAYGPYYNNMASSDFEDITVLDGLAFDDNGMPPSNCPSATMPTPITLSSTPRPAVKVTSSGWMNPTAS